MKTLTIQRLLFTFIFTFCVLPSTSCAQRSIYETVWKAEEYFNDPQLVALCKAIECEDIDEIDRLVAAGADVNARGKDSMTPLLWAYPAGEKSLERILEHGADPNTQYDSGFRAQGMIDAGDSLLFIAMKSTSPFNTRYVEKFQNYVDILLKHGADPNLVQKNLKTVPLYSAIQYRNTEAAKKLIQAGADMDWKDDTGRPLVYYAAGFKAYPVLQLLLDNGADYRVIDKSNGLTAVHDLGSSYRLMQDNSELGHQYQEIVAWFDKRGISIDIAKEQREQWKMMDKSNPDEFVKKYIAEVSGPEVAKWLPPGVEPAVEEQEVAPPPAAPPLPPQRAWNPLPVIAVVVVLLLLAGGIWFWMRRGKGGNVPP